MKATEVSQVTAGLAESNGSLLPFLRRDSLHVTCGLTACTPGSAPGPTFGTEYGKTLPFFTCRRRVRDVTLCRCKAELDSSDSALDARSGYDLQVPEVTSQATIDLQQQLLYDLSTTSVRRRQKSLLR